MHINYGNELFMPEGDDYSKTEFDLEKEKMISSGNQILQQLRMEQMYEQAKNVKIHNELKSESVENSEKEKAEENTFSFKELLNSVAASK